MRVPLLLRLATDQNPVLGPATRYDDEADELVVVGDDGMAVFAVDVPDGRPMTKKADIEKGEDAKDRW